MDTLFICLLESDNFHDLINSMKPQKKKIITKQFRTPVITTQHNLGQLPISQSLGLAIKAVAFGTFDGTLKLSSPTLIFGFNINGRLTIM